MPRVARLSIAPVRGLGLQHPDTIDADRRRVSSTTGGSTSSTTTAGSSIDFAPRAVRVHAETDADGRWLRLTLPDGRSSRATCASTSRFETDDLQSRIADRARRRRAVGSRARAVRASTGPARPLRPPRRHAHPPGRDAGPERREPRLRRIPPRARAPARRAARRWPPLPDADRARGRRRRTRRTAGSAARSRIGTAVVSVTKPDARCAITTQDPDTGERDLDTLRTILRYRGFRADDPEHKIDFGVLGEVRRPGGYRWATRSRCVAGRSGRTCAPPA